MSRNIIRIIMAVVVLNAIVVASAMIWPNTATSTANEVPTATVDFNHAFDSVTTAQRRASTPAPTTVDFEAAFDSLSAPSRINTPPNRERLRNIGWRRILGSS